MGNDTKQMDDLLKDPDFKKAAEEAILVYQTFPKIVQELAELQERITPQSGIHHWLAGFRSGYIAFNNATCPGHGGITAVLNTITAIRNDIEAGKFNFPDENA